MKFRIGHGYDVHRISPERKMVLGGVEIPCGYGLEAIRTEMYLSMR